MNDANPLGAVATVPVAFLPVGGVQLAPVASGTTLPCLTAPLVRRCQTPAVLRVVQTAPPAVCPPNIRMAA